MRALLILPLLLIPASLAGCGSDDGSSGAAEPGADSGSSTTDPTSPPTSGAAADPPTPASTRPEGEDGDGEGVLVEFGVSGGFLGRDDTLVLFRNGDIEAETARGAWESAVPQSAVDELGGMLAASDLFDRDREILGSGADLQQYSIRYSGVTILTDDSQLPPELLASIELLESLVNGGPVD
jgi:hypothetical protein